MCSFEIDEKGIFFACVNFSSILIDKVKELKSVLIIKMYKISVM